MIKALCGFWQSAPQFWHSQLIKRASVSFLSRNAQRSQTPFIYYCASYLIILIWNYFNEKPKYEYSPFLLHSCICTVNFYSLKSISRWVNWVTLNLLFHKFAFVLSLSLIVATPCTYVSMHGNVILRVGPSAIRWTAIKFVTDFQHPMRINSKDMVILWQFL